MHIVIDIDSPITQANAESATSIESELAQPTTSNISAIALTLPSSSLVNTIALKSGLFAFNVIFTWRQVME